MIDMNAAKSIFEKEGEYIILDVRHANEYEEGHIKGAKPVVMILVLLR